MTDLITRLEQAEAGSRELDAEIADLIKWWPEGFTRIDFHGRDRRWRKRAGVDERIDCPSYTISLDAVTALIGEKLPGYYFGLQENRWPQEPESTTRRWTAYLDTPRGGKDSEIEATHRDKHIACCIALLRAIKDGEHG